MIRRRFRALRYVLIAAILMSSTIPFAGLPGASAASADTADRNEAALALSGTTEEPHPSQTPKRFDAWVEQLQLDSGALQDKLDRGYALSDAALALEQEKLTGQSFEDSIRNIRPRPVNRSQGAESIIESDLGDGWFMMSLFNPATDHSYVNTKPEAAPYTVSLDQESISTLTGGLTVRQTDLVLPGRNGLSFALTRTYDSGSSQFGKMEINGSGNNIATGIPYEEDMFPIGTGWSWDIPSIEYANGKTYVHLSDKGTYERSGTTLKGYPWLDLTVSADTTVTVNGIVSADKVKTLGGLSYYFSGDGRLLQLSDPYNNKVQFEYATHPVYGAVLSTIRDAIGNTIAIAYSATEVTLTKGAEVVTYSKVQQNGKELLSKTIDPLGRETTYDYSIQSAQFNLLGTTPTTSNPYALLTGVFHPTGAKTIYTYETAPVTRYVGQSSVNQAYRLQSRKDQLTLENGSTADYNGKTVAYSGDAGSSFNQDFTFSVAINDGIATTSFENKKDYIDANTPPVFYNTKVTATSGVQRRTTTYTYDEARRWYWPVSESAVMSNTQTQASSAAVTVTRNYDDYANLVTETDPQGARTDYTYDAATHWLKTVTRAVSATVNQWTGYTRNAQGTVTRIEVRAGTGTGTLLQQIDFQNIDAYGNVTRVRVKDDARDLVTDTLFGAAHQYAFPTQQSTQVTNADGTTETVTQQFSFHLPTGQLTSFTDGRSLTTSYTYDILGRITNAAYPGGSSVRIRYDDYNNQVIGTDETGLSTYTRWNPLGWMTDAGLFAGYAHQAKTKSGHDAWGRVVWTEDALGNRTTYEYNDPWGRQTAAVDPQSHRTTTAYDDIGRKTTVTDAENNTFETVYDIVGRELERAELKTSGRAVLSRFVYDYGGHVKEAYDGNDHRTLYGYDAAGRLTSVTNALLQTTAYAYSLAGPLKQMTHPDHTTVQYAYDELGRLIRQTDPKGQIEKTYYDGNGNRTKLIDRTQQQFTYQYDSRNRLTQKNITGLPAETVTFGYDHAGRRTSMTDATGTTQYAYDTATGTLKRVTYPDSRTLHYDYDAQGNRRQLTDPFGANVYYAYDSNNRLASVGSAYQDPTPDASYAYFDNGLIQSVTRKNNVKTAYTYDGLRLDTLTHRKPDNSVLYSFNYDYDPNRNITSIAEGGATHTFAYDDLNRIETSSLLGQSFTYGSRGNRATFSSKNPPESPDAVDTFNKRDQLTQVAVTNGPTVSYKYNGDGLLYERTEGGQTTRYYYDGAVVIAEATVTGGVATLKARYLRGRELVAAEDAHREKAYYLHNGHGDVIELRDPTGNTALNRYTYDIWGNPLTSQESVHNPFRYSGEWWDKTTSLQYLRARWYDPSLGRFVSEDTYQGDITNPLTLNLYSYVHNNPLIYVDPTGHYCESADGKYSHSGGCADSSNASRYVPDDLYYANKGKSYDEIIGIYNRQKSEAIQQSVSIGWDATDEYYDSILVKNEVVALPNQSASVLATRIVQALGLLAVLGLEQAASTTAGSQQQSIIYRSGNGGAVNLTPRPVKDVDGLSYFTYLTGDKHTMTTIEAVNATQVLLAYPDPKNPQHILIIAKDPYEHQMWMASRNDVQFNGAQPYYLTTVLQNISIKLPGR